MTRFKTFALVGFLGLVGGASLGFLGGVSGAGLRVWEGGKGPFPLALKATPHAANLPSLVTIKAPFASATGTRVEPLHSEVRQAFEAIPTQKIAHRLSEHLVRNWSGQERHCAYSVFEARQRGVPESRGSKEGHSRAESERTGAALVSMREDAR